MIDHLVYAVPDLAVGITELQDRLGVQFSPGDPHEGLGTRNYLTGLGGGAYLSVIGPDPDQPEPAQPRPFGIDDLPPGGGRLAGWVARVSDITKAVEHALADGYDPGPVIPMSRRRPDGVLVELQLTPPIPGVLPSLMDWGTTPHPSETLDNTVELVSLTAFHPSPKDVYKGLGALGQELTVEPGEPGLQAVLRTPAGEVVLR